MTARPGPRRTSPTLESAIKHGSSVEDASEFLCRSGSVDAVARKAQELGLKPKRQKQSARARCSRAATLNCSAFEVSFVDRAKPARILACSRWYLGLGIAISPNAVTMRWDSTIAGGRKMTVSWRPPDKSGTLTPWRVSDLSR